MTIDCHRHYTTAPKALEAWRNRQIAGIKDPAQAPKVAELKISDDELREAVARCREAAVRIIGLSDHTVSHSLYVLDPDGNELELNIDVPGVDWKTNPEAVMAPTRPRVL